MMLSHTKRTRLVLGLAILSSFVGCDQAAKRIATDHLQQSASQSYLGDTVRLDYALNPGGFLGLGSSLTPRLRFCLFVGFNLCVTAVVVAFLVTNWNSRLVVFVSVVYVLAGGIGNLIDRVANDGKVTDFLNVGVGPFRSGIFNIADVGVMFGAIALLASLCWNPNVHPEPCETRVWPEQRRSRSMH